MPILGYIAILIISAVISYALAPKPPKPKPPEVGDIDAPTAEENRPIPVVFGTCRIKGPNVIWYGDVYTRPIIKSGGKK